MAASSRSRIRGLVEMFLLSQQSVATVLVIDGLNAFV
jgi:hypothetical protein